MRQFILCIVLLLSFDLSGQKDSCGCGEIVPSVSYLAQGRAYGIHSLYGKTTPYSGICHTFYMKVPYVQPDYSRTFEYAVFVNGEMEKFLKFNETGDTVLYFSKVKRNNVVAETKRYNYQNGQFEFLEEYYYQGTEKRMTEYGFNPKGWLISVANYILPPKGDSLNYDPVGGLNYKSDAQLGSDGFYSIPVQEGAYVQYSTLTQGQIIASGDYRNNHKHGKWTTWYDNGQIASEGSYSKYDWKNGNWKEWYESGQLKTNIDYTNGAWSGNYSEWYSSGQLKMQFQLESGKYVGENTSYWQNGQVQNKTLYVDGFKVKEHTFYANGQMERLSTYDKQGLRHGQMTEWYESGQVRSTVIFKNGAFCDSSVFYFENGQRSMEYHYETPNEVLARSYFTNGKVRSVENLSWGVRDGTCLYYFPNGVMRSNENYARGTLDGVSKTYTNAGKLISDISYHNGLFEGLCTWYFANGAIRRNGHYTAGVRNGEYKEWAENGRLVYEQNYVNGLPQKANLAPQLKSSEKLNEVKRSYVNDAQILACQELNVVGSGAKLFADSARISRITNDLAAIALCGIQIADSARLVHFDSSSSYVKCRLYYPYSEWHSDIDTITADKNCAWPKDIDPWVRTLQLKPVRGTCYSAGNYGNRLVREFTSDVFFGDAAFDSILKSLNPEYEFSMEQPANFQFNSTATRISIAKGENFTDYYFILFPNEGRDSQNYIRWQFRVYVDGSVDVIEFAHETFQFWYPE